MLSPSTQQERFPRRWLVVVVVVVVVIFVIHILIAIMTIVATAALRKGVGLCL
jgi:hypothetical protein